MGTLLVLIVGGLLGPTVPLAEPIPEADPSAIRSTASTVVVAPAYRHRVTLEALRLFSLLKPYLRVFRGLIKTNLPGYVGFFQFLRNFHQLTAFEQAEMILYAALDPAVAGKARKGDFVRCLDHFKLLQSPIN